VTMRMDRVFERDYALFAAEAKAPSSEGGYKYKIYTNNCRGSSTKQWAGCAAAASRGGWAQ